MVVGVSVGPIGGRRGVVVHGGCGGLSGGFSLGRASRNPGLGSQAEVEGSIEADGCPEAGGFVCHSVVDLSIKADGCPEAGDFGCHSGVDFWTIKADGCTGAGDFVCHLAVDLGCHWGVGFSAIRVDGSPGAGDLGLVRASDSTGNLGSASGVPLCPGWSSNAVRPTKPWWPFLCSVLLAPS